MSILFLTGLSPNKTVPKASSQRILLHMMINIYNKAYWFVTDTYTERNLLITKIFPRLKSYCRESYGMDFQVGQGAICDILIKC